MKRFLLTVSLATVISMGLAQSPAPSTSFTYQGFLQDSSTPADGPFCFEFQVYDAETGGAPVGPLLLPCNVTVEKGRFTVDLDFGAEVFTGEPRWLEIKVVNGPATTVLAPRQKINPTPQAIYANTAGHAATATEAASATTASVALTADNGAQTGHSILTDSLTPPPGYVYTGESISFGTPSWSSVNASRAFYESAVGGVNGKVYIVHGDTTSEYTLEGNTFVTKAPQPTSRHSSRGAVIGNKFYVVGGRNSSGPSSDLTYYDPTTDHWEVLASAPAGRIFPAVTSVGTKLYVIGGRDDSSSTNTTYIYNTVNDSWTTGSPAPTARQGAYALATGDKIHYLGSFDSSEASAHDVYDIATDTWTSLPVTPVSFRRSMGLAFRERLHMLGGQDSTSTHYIYDPAAQAWTTGLALPHARHSGHVALIDAARFLLLHGTYFPDPSGIFDIYNAGGGEYHLHTRQ